MDEHGRSDDFALLQLQAENPQSSARTLGELVDLSGPLLKQRLDYAREKMRSTAIAEVLAA